MLVFALTLVFAISASAASAFENVVINESTELYDDPETMNLGGNGTTISYMEAYGVGNSSLNDMVIFKGVDFGANGADKMVIFFSYGNNDDTKTKIEVYVDKAEGTPVATYKIGFTGGWESTLAQEFEAPVSISGGTHDIYVKFANEKSGSFTYVRFNEAPAPAPAAETENPETSDFGFVYYVLSSISALGFFSSLNKKNK
jgi:hypothetical protein